MSRKKNRKTKSREAAPEPRSLDTGETRTADAATVAWSVAVVTVLMCDLAAAAAYAYTAWRPEAKRLFLLAELLVIGGSMVAAVVLVLTPALYRLRRVAPPQGLVVFALCAAAAPIVALLVRSLR